MKWYWSREMRGVNIVTLKHKIILGCHFDVAVKLDINKVKYFNDNNKDDDVNDS